MLLGCSQIFSKLSLFLLTLNPPLTTLGTDRSFRRVGCSKTRQLLGFPRSSLARSRSWLEMAGRAWLGAAAGSKAAAAADVPAPKTAADGTVPEPPGGFSTEAWHCYYVRATAEGDEPSEETSWKEAYTLVRKGVITVSGRCSDIGDSLGLLFEAVVFRAVAIIDISE